MGSQQSNRPTLHHGGLAASGAERNSVAASTWPALRFLEHSAIGGRAQWYDDVDMEEDIKLFSEAG